MLELILSSLERLAKIHTELIFLFGFIVICRDDLVQFLIDLMVIF
ncbi:hypothetical protein ACGRL8_13055 [Vibrio rumoiensis]